MDIEKELENQWKHVNVYGSVAIFNNMKLMIQEIVKEYEGQLNTAENELIELRAYKEAAEIQVPFAWANNQGETTINEILVEYWRCGGYEITPLYANPSVAVPDGEINFDVELPVIREMLKQGGHMKEAQIAQQTLAYIIALRREFNALKMASNLAPSHSQQSARITEQDAREVAWSALYCSGEKYGRALADEVNGWFEQKGRKLLEKLNADRCPSHESEQGGAV